MKRYAPLVTPMLAPSSSAPPMVMVLLPARNTLLAALFLVFPVTVGAPDTVKVVLALSLTYTPLLLLPVMLPPLMVKVPPHTYTPPPWSAVLSVTLAFLFMLKVPLFTNTPPPLVVAVLLLTLVSSPFISNLPPLTYTPPPLPSIFLLPDAAFLMTLELPFMVKVPPSTYTPPPLRVLPLAALLPVTLALPFISKVPLFTYTPPPLLPEPIVFAVTLASLFMMNLPLASTYTPAPPKPSSPYPPLLVLLLMVPPSMLKVPLFTYTPPP